jgi:subtilisin family serine protease
MQVFPSSRRQAAPKRPAAARLAVEALEDRQVMSATSPFAASGLHTAAVDTRLFDEESILVRLRPGVANLDTQSILAGTQFGAAVDASAGLYEVKLGAGLDLDKALAAFGGSSLVAYAQRNYRVHVMATPTDPSFSGDGLWGLNGAYGINAPAAWDTTTGKAGVAVGIIDTGIDYTHPDLYKNIWINQKEIPASAGVVDVDPDGPGPLLKDGIITFWDLNDPANAGKLNDSNTNGYIDGKDILSAWSNGIDDGANGFKDDLVGWNFVSNTNNPMDDYDHGTHVAGTIGALANNYAQSATRPDGRVVGVNWQVQMAALKFMGSNGSGSTTNAIKALNYAVNNGIPITNNSWGGGGSQALYDAINAARNQGHIFVAAAGNGGSDQIGDNNDAMPNYPASYNLDNIISVAALKADGSLANFSNYGATSVDLAAPGHAILSTIPWNLDTSAWQGSYFDGTQDGYATYNGTSMATPHVTGVVALLKSQYPDWSYTEIINQVLTTVTPTASLGGKTVTGGRLNAQAALQGYTPPANDLAVTSVSAPGSANTGSTVAVDVIVKNTGTEAMLAGVLVTLTATDGSSATATIANDLAPGITTTVHFDWPAPANAGNYVLTASVPADENPNNNTGAAAVTVIDPSLPQTPLYLTVADSGTVTLGGLSVQNEDIVLYENGAYTLFFDGTPALGGSSGGFAIDAVAVLSSNEFLISLDQYGGINGTNITVYDEDIIKFKRNSATDPWVASVYFDGSDVGLTTSWFSGTTGAEGVDAIERLSDGRILISTKGNFSVSGLSGADEDVIRFTPTSTGTSTAGSWSMYFDGSNYGLADGGENEDVDGISVDDGGKLYLSTKGNFAVPISGAPPLSGTGSDVFVFAGGAYRPNLYFASTNLGGKSLFSIELPPGFVAPSSAASQKRSAPKAAAAPVYSGLADLGSSQAASKAAPSQGLATPRQSAAIANRPALKKDLDAALNLLWTASDESSATAASATDWTLGLEGWLQLLGRKG